MYTILLLRHAKSSWKDAALVDHDRPLNGRGRRDAPRVGRYLAEADLLPDHVLCSTAVRARQTLDAARAEWDDSNVSVDELDALYPTDPDLCSALLRALPDDVGRVLVVGHNPGLEELLTELTGRAEALPTAALAEVTVNVPHWSSLVPDGSATLVQVWRPKESEP
jgi:phosphohistidine phosphatase